MKKRIVDFMDLIEIWEEDSEKVWVFEGIALGKCPSVSEIADIFGYRFIENGNYYLHESVSYEESRLPVNDYEEIRVFKEDGKFYMQFKNLEDFYYDSSEIEISRVTYCALLVDTKLSDSLL